MKKIFYKRMKTMFVETDGTWSWRKIMTASVLICFVVAVFGFLITHNFGELPMSYQAIIAGVFVFYFGKDIVRKAKI